MQRPACCISLLCSSNGEPLLLQTHDPNPPPGTFNADLPTKILIHGYAGHAEYNSTVVIRQGKNPDTSPGGERRCEKCKPVFSTAVYFRDSKANCWGAWITSGNWRWRQHFPLKHYAFSELHGGTTQRTVRGEPEILQTWFCFSFCLKRGIFSRASTPEMALYEGTSAHFSQIACMFTFISPSPNLFICRPWRGKVDTK